MSSKIDIHAHWYPEQWVRLLEKEGPGIGAEIARELAVAGEALGLLVADAPVSGGQAGAQNGQLTIMVGGSDAAYAAAEPIMAAYAKIGRAHV